MHIPSKMQIYIFHRNDLRITASGCSALYTENRSQRRFSKCQYRISACFIHCLCQTNADGCFTFSCRSRINSSNKYKLTVFFICQFSIQLLRKLSLIFSVEFHIIRINSQILSYIHNRLHLSLVSNFDIT